MIDKSEFMKRRLASSGSFQNMDGCIDFPEPETPPPAWSPLKGAVFWQQPSRWQICAPRLRSVAKFMLLGTLIFAMYTILLIKPSTIDRYRAIVAGPEKAVTEPKQDWMWNDFQRHNGLIRGLKRFATCHEPSDCGNRNPKVVRYPGTSLEQQGDASLRPCKGPRGLVLNESAADAVWAYQGIADGAVAPSMGSYEASGLDGSVSFDRFGRYQAYGIHQFESFGNRNPFDDVDIDWDNVRWGDLQRSCIELNKDRFEEYEELNASQMQYSDSHSVHKASVKLSSEESSIAKMKRTAILIRVWTGATWSADAVLNIRAMVAEASIASGGKYQVFLLLHVKDERIPLFTGEHQPMDTIERYVPPEFHSMTEVWNDAQMRSLYSNIVEHAFVGRSPWMAVQWFARNHPEFDFFYQWEFDVRFTGHYLDLLEAVSAFGRDQPRKGSWERAGRMYIPEIHGRFNDEFRQLTKDEDPHHVWGPVAVEGVKPRGPKPPRKQHEDQYLWGVGEDADWIGFLPSFNVTETNWWFKDYLWGYAQGNSIPRRATLIAQGRVSRRVLEIMNYENTENGHHVDAEMFPQTICLHHGLKSVSFPHPIFADRLWPPEALQSIFNGGPHGQAGGFLKSTFSKWNEDAWTNFTWYYSSAQAKPLYQNFLGIATTNGGGTEWEAANGRAVIRPMLLHPVKGAKSIHWTTAGWKQSKGIV